MAVEDAHDADIFVDVAFSFFESPAKFLLAAGVETGQPEELKASTKIHSVTEK